MGRTESQDEEVTGIRHTTTGPLLVGLLGPRCGDRRISYRLEDIRNGVFRRRFAINQFAERLMNGVLCLLA